MESSQEDVSIYVPSNVASDEMNWDAYSEHYDEMCELNPSYQENVGHLVKYLKKWNLPGHADICDLGAGTGNYIAAVSEHLPNANFVHVDCDQKMNDAAQMKYDRLQIKNTNIIAEYAQRLEFDEDSFDLILCVNALYAISPQKQVLQKINSWLKPDGKFFIIDFGRKQRTIEWAMYLFRESMKEHRVGRYVKALFEGREVLKQNRRSTKGQASGRYWLHSTTEFGNTLVDCGLDVHDVFPCYRGYADLAVCSKGTR